MDWFTGACLVAIAAGVIYLFFIRKKTKYEPVQPDHNVPQGPTPE